MPMGTSPFGLGTPAAAAVPPDGPAGSRYLNPITRDYEVDSSTGQFKQMPGTRQRVLIALLTVRNSSGIPGFGVRAPVRMGDSFEAEMQNAVRQALRHMSEIEKSIRIDDIKVERGLGGRSRTTVSFTDLVTGDQYRERV
jgi:hypothetical protein